MMRPQSRADEERDPETQLRQSIAALAQSASVEVNIQDVKHLAACQALLAPGTQLFVSHPPQQTWLQAQVACRAVREAGFEPVPHLPVRLLEHATMLDRTLSGFVRAAAVEEVLLIAGDYPAAAGPYATVADVLRSGLLSQNGLRRVSIAGHPEGHPRVALEQIRQAEADKVAIATERGLEVTLVTQFFFESEPFIHWVNELRARGIHSKVAAGIAGPASLTTLFKYAVRCGAGPSIRALGARPASFVKLIGEHGPERLVRELAHARDTSADFSRLHLFCFGGVTRCCEWLHAVAAGRFDLDDTGGFRISGRG